MSCIDAASRRSRNVRNGRALSGTQKTLVLLVWHEECRSEMGGRSAVQERSVSFADSHVAGAPQAVTPSSFDRGKLEEATRYLNRRDTASASDAAAKRQIHVEDTLFDRDLQYRRTLLQANRSIAPSERADARLAREARTRPKSWFTCSSTWQPPRG